MVRAWVVCAAVAMAAAGCKQRAQVPQCPAKFAELPEALRASGGECACPLGVGSGAVWGTGIYTQDSALCAAAAHAGALDPAKGGAVKFKAAPGCQRYAGTNRREVTTSSWKQYPASFYFPGFGEPACPSAMPNECPDTFLAIPNAAQLTSFSCNCDGPGQGSVWGSGLYTRDSSLCAAAVHAGAVAPAGGKVTVRPADACLKYRGSTRNQVATADWGRYELGSFYFEDFGDGACEAISADACPPTYLGIPESDQVTSFSCTCGSQSEGQVWGTDVYTRDSSLCRAALHAGVLPDAEGRITVRPGPACPRYSGASRNGVTSAPWGSYDLGSFVFDGASARLCP